MEKVRSRCRSRAGVQTTRVGGFDRRNSMEFGEENGKGHTEMAPVREVALRRRLFPTLGCGVEPVPHPHLDQFALALRV